MASLVSARVSVFLLSLRHLSAVITTSSSTRFLTRASPTVNKILITRGKAREEKQAPPIERVERRLNSCGNKTEHFQRLRRTHTHTHTHTEARGIRKLKSLDARKLQERPLQSRRRSIGETQKGRRSRKAGISYVHFNRAKIARRSQTIETMTE